MSRLFVSFVSVLLAAGAMAGCSKNDNAKVQSVRGLQTNSGAYQGTVTIGGVVAMISRNDPKMFAVMDFDDVRDNVPPEKRLYMPVRYEGTIPRVGEPVNITGSFAEGTKYFTATNVTIRR